MKKEYHPLVLAPVELYWHQSTDSDLRIIGRGTDSKLQEHDRKEVENARMNRCQP
jgi:hypothetical protein